MTVDVTTKTEIERPRAEVAAYVGDPDNATEWYEHITSARWETSPPAKVGSRIAFTARFLGRELAYTYEVRDILADERFVMSTAQGPFPMETTYSWEDLPSGGTRMTLRNRGTPTGFSKIATPMLAAAMRRAHRKDLARLKAVLETGHVN
jgi:hypothetical protein